MKSNYIRNFYSRKITIKRNLPKISGFKLVLGISIFWYLRKKVRSIYARELQRPKQNSKINMFYSAFLLPHIEKRGKGGEDAYYISSNILAVADGVGGWNSYGVDPSKYSKELCEHIKDEYNRNDNYSEEGAKEILIRAAYRTKAVGSSTCCLILLDDNSYKIYTANIGDSGYLIITNENGKLIEHYKSEEQQHSFNFPFQIGTNGDNPNKASTNTHVLKANDIIVVASDGLWDNLDSSQIIEVLNKHISYNGRIKDTQKAAKDIAELAENKSLDRNYDSPFAKKARQSKMRYKGGKPDDITVIVAQLEESKQIPHHELL